MCMTAEELNRIRDEIIEDEHSDKIKDMPIGSGPDNPCVGDPTIWRFE